MTIAIDATTLLLPSAGVKTYLHYWLLSLLAGAPDYGDTIRAYPLAVPVTSTPDHERSVAGRLGTALRLRLVQLGNLRGNPAVNLLVWGSDCFHASQHTTNLPRRVKTSATIFDLSCWTTPQYHTPANIAATRAYAERVLQTANGLIAISKHAAEDAAKILRIPASRIRVIYPGVAGSFFSAASADVEAVKTRHRLEAPYLLFVGCIEPRKNVPGLINAYRQTPAWFQRDVHLLLVGPYGWNADGVRQMLESAGKTVRYLGYVPEADIPGLVRGAVALVYPSYYEGFGLPVAQAMAAGAPVIGSNRGSIPEILGGAGICVDPDSAEEIGAAMQRVASSPQLARDLVSRGRVRAEEFRWEKSADRSLQFFHDL